MKTLSAVLSALLPTGYAARMAIVFYVVAVPALAQAPNCADIGDDMKRLACYDHGAKPKEKTMKPQTATTPPSKPSTGTVSYALLDYRTRLEHAFLESGISANVVIQTKHSTPGMRDFGRYPELIIWAYLSKAMVFQLITQGKILDNAKQAGFEMVDFFDKGNEGHWFFDLTKAGNCDVYNRLCY